MKNIIRAILVLFAFGFISCEDHLDSVPYSFTSPENFYNTGNDAEIALNGVYATLTDRRVNGVGPGSTFSANLLFILNCATDETAWNQNVTNQVYGAVGNAAVTTDHTMVNDYWYYFYSGINRANYLLEKLPEITDINEERRLQIEAEARVLRGIFHMYLSMLHGAIPTYQTSIQDPEKARQPVSEVYELVLSDLEFGYQNLPDRALTVGRLNKWSSAGYLAKVYTYLASFKMSGVSDFGFSPNSFDWVDEASYYQEALDVTNDIIDNSGYFLVAEYGELFRETTKTTQHQECLFMAECSADPSLGAMSQLNQAWIPNGALGRVGGGPSWCRPTGELFDKYLAGDIRGEHNLTLHIPTNNNPPILVDGVSYYEPLDLVSSDVGQMSIGKYRYQDPATKSMPVWASQTNLSLVRFADILLLNAEAKYFTGDESGARERFTEIRRRAAGDESVVTLADLENAYTKGDFLEELLDERSRELCFEMWRRIDLARFNIYSETINSLNPENGFYNAYATQIQANWKPEKIWMPIPIQQRDLNPNLDQNPGY